MGKLKYPIALSFLALLLFAAVPLFGHDQPGLAWLASAVLMTAFVAVAGYAVTGRWIGALIDDRNVVSLARFQMALWTCLVLSAFVTAALLDLQHDAAKALAITVPGELWALMGISTTSLVGSPLILATKADKPANAAEMLQTLGLLSSRGAAPSDNKGQLIVNRDIAGARWSDLFTGEEVANAAYLDLTRIQMFFFTVLTAATYGASLFWMFTGFDAASGVHALPSLDRSMVALIGISQAGYLTAKAIPRSQDPAAPGPRPPAG